MLSEPVQLWHISLANTNFLTGQSQCNSSPPRAAYMLKWIGSSLVQVMALCLFGGDKPLPEPMLAYRQLDSWGYISVKLETEFSFKKMHLKMSSAELAAHLSRGRWDKGNPKDGPPTNKHIYVTQSYHWIKDKSMALCRTALSPVRLQWR